MSDSAIPLSAAEHWLPVEGFGHYEVSDLGRVRSIDRVILCANRWGTPTYRTYRGRMLTHSLHDCGYHFVILSLDRVSYQRYVHDLVAAAFIGPRPPGQLVCHGPNGPADNRPSQLRYDTPAGNSADRARDGTETRGIKHPLAKLNDAAVREIRARYAAGGVTLEQLAGEYGVTFGNIGMVIRRATWQHIH